jgi:tRNA 2-thiouridine synthesizing protein A
MHLKKNKEKIGMEIQNKNYYTRRYKMEIEGIRIDDTVDITDKVCPLTFVKAKVAIDELEDGEVIAIRMNDGEPVQNVPRSIKEEGHQILKLVNNEDGTYNLIVKKVED